MARLLEAALLVFTAILVSMCCTGDAKTTVASTATTVVTTTTSGATTATGTTTTAAMTAVPTTDENSTGGLHVQYAVAMVILIVCHLALRMLQVLV